LIAVNLVEDPGFPPDESGPGIPPSTFLGTGTTAGVSISFHGSGQYHITFPNDVSNCTGVANAYTAGASVNVQMGTPSNNEATLFTFNFNDGFIHIFPVSFYMLVSC